VGRVLEPVHAIAQNEIDDPTHGVGAVDRRRAVGKDFDPFDEAQRISEMSA